MKQGNFMVKYIKHMEYILGFVMKLQSFKYLYLSSNETMLLISGI